MRNQVNNRNKQEEMNYKRSKVQECRNNPSKTWGLAKSFMEWSSPGPPTQLEVEEENQITLYRKAKDLARIMNEFFVSKVQAILKGLKNVPVDLNGCKKIMLGKRITLSMRHVTVGKVRELLRSLKNTTSTSVDQLDNFAVKIAADEFIEAYTGANTL